MSVKNIVLFFLFVFLLILPDVSGQKQNSSPDRLWIEINETALAQKQSDRFLIPKNYRTFFLNKSELKNLLKTAPLEFTEKARDNSQVITLPMPDGKFARFLIYESPVMEAGLAAQHPNVKTFSGKGIDDPTAIARFDITPQGFHSMILSSNGTVLVDPYTPKDSENYISYYKADAADSREEFVCNVKDKGIVDAAFDYKKFMPEMNVTSGTALRTYRLAVAATGEYTNVFRQPGDTDAVAKTRALNAITTIMNRVNGIYERDLSMRMILVANEEAIIYTNSATDPYTNTNGSMMLGENQTNIDAVIGAANYDIGHVFSTGGGGVANLRVPCGSGKARGVTGLLNPVGDPFAIDYVSHEMGHQWGGNHTFNGTINSCAFGNRSAFSAYEPGSGITIMGYAGICGNQNLASNSIDTFHVRTLEEIVDFSQSGSGNTCAVVTGNGNAPPFIDAAASFNVPKKTPFTLTATGFDLNSDSLTYDWQEYDLGAETTSVPNTDIDGARPIFRVYAPTSDGTRTFPSLKYILNNANVPPASVNNQLVGEMLPSITRTMNFQVVIRDNRLGGGGINSATTAVNVDGGSGPFVVSAPNENVIWGSGSTQNITWDVANTNNAPISAANVKISLSTDGGQTFTTVLAESTPNDGSQTVTLPNVSTNQARIKIEAVGNIFFDISDANFTIASSAPTAVAISGRILSSNGRGIFGARVLMTNGGSVTRMATSNPFGFYQFENVNSGTSYTFTVTDKRYKFNNPTIVQINNSVSGNNFTALP